jgi:hypothetical protein
MRRLFFGFQTFLAVYPYVPLVLLYLLAFRAVTHRGHWPLPGLDDPKNFGQNDALYVGLYDSLHWLLVPWTEMFGMFPGVGVPLYWIFSWIGLVPLIVLLLLPSPSKGATAKTRHPYR